MKALHWVSPSLVLFSGQFSALEMQLTGGLLEKFKGGKMNFDVDCNKKIMKSVKKFTGLYVIAIAC